MIAYGYGGETPMAPLRVASYWTGSAKSRGIPRAISQMYPMIWRGGVTRVRA